MRPPSSPRRLRTRLASALLGASWLLGAPGASGKPVLSITDTLAVDGALRVETDAWALVFSTFFNGGIHQWYDKASDPSESDNLTTSSNGGNYNTGTLFDYDVYLGFGFSQINEFMTTVGRNAGTGALNFEVLERTPTRLRVRQQGHPRLNNGTGPPGDPFVELPFVNVVTDWTIYPTGRVAIEFHATRNPAGEIVDQGPGGSGKGVQAVGPPFDNWLNATGGADFLAVFATAGDTIESPGGGWGPVHIVQRVSPTQLIVESPVPPGTWDYVIRRDEVRLETISIHADGDPGIASQCSDPATSRWAGGSNGDPLWTSPLNDGCGTLGRSGPPASQDVILAHWATDRPVGSLLAFFEPWAEATSGFFNDTGFTDISYTQLGRVGFWSFEPHHRHFLAHLGSAGAADLPVIQSVADALPIGTDYRTPFAEALVGRFATGPEIAGHGFDPGRGAYRIVAEGHEAIVRFDTQGGGRGGLAYFDPVIEIENFFVADGDVVVERSTDGSATFSALPADSYNLTTRAEEAEVGAGRRVFQFLGEIPATATGAAAWAFRFASLGPTDACANGLDDDGDGRIDTADPGCAMAIDASERRTSSATTASTTTATASSTIPPTPTAGFRSGLPRSPSAGTASTTTATDS